jgi:hypothetical protein
MSASLDEQDSCYRCTISVAYYTSCPGGVNRNMTASVRQGAFRPQHHRSAGVCFRLSSEARPGGLARRNADGRMRTLSHAPKRRQAAALRRSAFGGREEACARSFPPPLGRSAADGRKMSEADGLACTTGHLPQKSLALPGPGRYNRRFEHAPRVCRLRWSRSAAGRGLFLTP